MYKNRKFLNKLNQNQFPKTTFETVIDLQAKIDREDQDGGLLSHRTETSQFSIHQGDMSTSPYEEITDDKIAND